jgi:hypothetical protein
LPRLRISGAMTSSLTCLHDANRENFTFYIYRTLFQIIKKTAWTPP